jgi:hypothetical protein
MDKRDRKLQTLRRVLKSVLGVSILRCRTAVRKTPWTDLRFYFRVRALVPIPLPLALRRNLV